MDTEEKLLMLVKERRAEDFKKAAAETENFDINEFFNDLFPLWDLGDIEFFASCFDIKPNIHDHAFFITPDMLDIFLSMGAELSKEDVSNLLVCDEKPMLEVLLMHQVPIDEETVFGWASLSRREMMQTYLDLGGDPDIRDESGRSLADVWYFWNGDAEDDEILDTLLALGVELSPDAISLDVMAESSEKAGGAEGAAEANPDKCKDRLEKTLSDMDQAIADMKKVNAKLREGIAKLKATDRAPKKK